MSSGVAVKVFMSSAGLERRNRVKPKQTHKIAGCSGSGQGGRDVARNSTSTCPFSTASPGRTRTARTTPAAVARSSFSIFMASSTTSPAPATTGCPASHLHPDHQARHRRLERGRAARLVARRRSGPGCGGSRSSTTSSSHRSPCAGERPAAAARPPRPPATPSGRPAAAAGPACPAPCRDWPMRSARRR